MADRKAYEKVCAYFSPEDFSPPGKIWWGLVEDWYRRDRASASVDRDAISVLAATRITNPKQRDVVVAFLQSVPTECSTENIVQVALELRRHSVGMQLAAAIASGNREQHDRLIRDYAALSSATEPTKTKAVVWDEADEIDSLFDRDRKSTRLNSSHVSISYAVF